MIILDNTLADGTGIEWVRRIIDSEDRGGVRLPQTILLRSLSEEFDEEYLQKIGGSRSANRCSRRHCSTR